MKLVIAILILVLPHITIAQQYGVQWVIGDKESVLDFRNDTLTNYAIGPEMPMFLTEANICDSNGNLLYYTNGIYIAGADGNQIANGDSINPCSYTNQWACCGLNIPQAALFLPEPSNSRYYYLIHFSNDANNGARPGTLYYSLLDSKANNGNGEVIQKNISFFNGEVFREGGMTACKHGNGRDWWITIGNEYNTYYTFLVTPNGISAPLIQTIGPSYYNGIDVGYSKFSQDGSKFVTSCYSGPILVMDFDRCSGQFSNPIVTSNPGDGAIVEFSPNGRFVYATNSYNLTQLDLTLSNPDQDSISLYQADSSDVALMDFLQLAPNGKLYASCFNGGFYFIHAINYPDLKGDSADYVDTAFTTLTVNSANFPNMVNYQLGALLNSGCDTVHTDTTGVGIIKAAGNNLLRIMPNPADKYLYVEMGMQGNYEFDLLNVTGQVIDRKETRQVDNFDTEHLASGVYFLRVVDKNNRAETASKRIVVDH